MKKNSDTVNLRQRISALSDRVVMLENNLKRTQEAMSSDIKKLVEAMRTIGKE